MRRQRIMKILRDPALQAITGIIGIIITILIASLQGNYGDLSDFVSTPTNTFSEPTISTPSKPVLEALHDLEIREGPGLGFPGVGMLAKGTSIDILGISEDGMWYQVLLRDGSTGWVFAGESGSRVQDEQGLIQMVILTGTPTTIVTYTPTSTYTSTISPTVATSPTYEPTNIVVHTPIQTATTDILLLSPVPIDIETPETRSYPCKAIIVDSASSSLNVVRARASSNSPLVRSVTPGESITIISRSVVSGNVWYQIKYGAMQATGWILMTYVIPSANCP